MTDYSDMSIDCLIDTLDSLHEHSSLWWEFDALIRMRCAARDAILDLADELDAEGLVVVPREPTVRMLGAADGYTDLIQPFTVEESAGEEGSKEAKEWRHNEFKCAWWAMINNAPLLAAAPLPEGV